MNATNKKSILQPDFPSSTRVKMLLKAVMTFTNVDPKVDFTIVRIEMLRLSSPVSFLKVWTAAVHHPHCLLLQQKIPPATSTLNLSVGMASA